MRIAKRKTRASGVDVHALADRQLSSDRERTRRFPDLFNRKMHRMSASPLAFLRGAAPLFYELLVEHAHLADGPPGEGWIVGDVHLENFGAYRPGTSDLFAGATGPRVASASSTRKRSGIFNLNDFDDTIIGPWRLDVLRLTTSLLLGGRELGADGNVALGLADRLMNAWSRAAFAGELPSEPPPPVAALVEQVSTRQRAELLDARTEIVHGVRRFVRGPRYADLPAEVLAAVPDALERFLPLISEGRRPPKEAMKIIDAALRIAGTGSLGGLRVAVLVEGKGGRDGGWVFDLKEEGTPSAAVLLGAPKAMDPATRVVTGFRACVAQPVRTIGATKMTFPQGGGTLAPPTTAAGKKGKRDAARTTTLSMFGRRLAPQEDKLNLRKLRGADLPALASYLGALLGAAHARGATKAATTPWSRSDRETILDNAITLAGIHEGVYLSLCDRIRRAR